MVTYLFVLLTNLPVSDLFSPNQLNHRWDILILIFISTFLFPVLSILIMKHYKVISSLKMRRRKERTLPFSLISLFYWLSTYLFWNNKIFDSEIIMMFGGVSLLIVLLTLINTVWKISIHSAGMGGALGILWLLNQQDPYQKLYPVILVSILVCGAVMTARLYLNCHTPRQVYAGTVLGFTVCYGLLKGFLFL